MKHCYKFSINIIIISILMMSLLVASNASESRPTSSPEPSPSSITIKPSSPAKIFLGQTVKFSATGNYSDGSTGDITSKVKWTVSDTAVAAISGSGLAGAVAPKNTHGSALSDSAGVKVAVSAELKDITSSPVYLKVANSGGPGAYYQSGGSATASKQSFITSNINESGIKITDAGIFTLSDSLVAASGLSSVTGLSSSVGLNAGVLAENGAKLIMDNCIITTTGVGANGAFAHGENSLVKMSDVKIKTTGAGAHGLDVTYLGQILIQDSFIHTYGPMGCASLSADTGDGSVTAIRVKTITEGDYSPGFYAIGAKSLFKVIDSELTARISEGGLLTTSVTVFVENSSLTGKVAGVSLSQGSTLTVTGGSIHATAGPAIVVEGGPGVGRHDISKIDMTPLFGTSVQQESGSQGVYRPAEGQAGSAPGAGPGGNAQGGAPPGGGAQGPGGGPSMGASAGSESHITVKGGAKLSGSTGNIVHVKESSKAVFIAEDEDLTGNLFVEEGCALKATLRRSALTGSVQGASMTIEEGSSWTLMADSTVAGFINREGISGSTVKNITGNGNTIYYDREQSKELGGKTYSLMKGGKLTPKTK